MSARILDGRPIAARLREEVTTRCGALAAEGHRPTLAIVRFTDAGPEVAYAESLARAATRVGARAMDVHLPAEVSMTETAEAIERLNEDPSVDGVVVIYPVPHHLEREAVDRLVDPTKDVDGINPVSTDRLEHGQPTFVPATALAVLEILRDFEVPIAGRDAVVVGRSRVVGQPTSILLANAGANVAVAHRRTPDLARATRPAEILVVAAGVPRLIGPEHVNPNAVVVDCGINVVGEQVIGDVDYERVQPLVAAITPVPGGVGPVTTIMLLEQVVTAAERAALAIPTAG